MDRDYYFYILSVIPVVYNSFLCKENPFFPFDFNQWFLNKNQVILIVIKITDLNQADLNQPTLPLGPIVNVSCKNRSKIFHWNRMLNYYSWYKLTSF